MTFLEDELRPTKLQRQGDAAITRILNNKLRKAKAAQKRGDLDEVGKIQEDLFKYLDFSQLYFNYLHAKSLFKHKLDWKLINRYMKKRKIWEKVVLTNGGK